MDENIKCVALLFVSLVVYEYNVFCGELSPLSENHLACLIYAGNFHEGLQSSFCGVSNPDLNVWHQNHEECKEICTITAQNQSCSDSKSAVRASFKFDIDLPVNTYFTGTCQSCFNITQINITCKLDIISMNSEVPTTQNMEITTAEMISETHLVHNGEITTEEMISRSSVNTKTTKNQCHKGDKVEFIVAAGFSGAVFGALITVGIWMLQRKLSKDKSWKRRSTVQNSTYNDSSRSSNPQPEPTVSLGNRYFDIVPQNNQSYTQTEECVIYNHLNEKPENTEDTDSPYDHAQYQQSQPDTILDSDYMHISKL